jgi:RimJ/RimL family protein N-acetyltransferase
MAPVLGDERLHEFIGGRPLTEAELRDRYTVLAAGASDPGETWLNWIVRRREDSAAVGTVQATLTTQDGRRTAHIAWVIGVDFQNQGFATEAARALVEWLWQQGMDDVVANIHPDHRPSALVAARAGLESTDEEVDGERVWRASGDA